MYCPIEALGYQAPGSRLTMHGDLSAVVVQLRWPGGTRATPLGRLGKADVQRRWDLVRMWLDYRRARRCVTRRCVTRQCDNQCVWPGGQCFTRGGTLQTRH